MTDNNTPRQRSEKFDDSHNFDTMRWRNRKHNEEIWAICCVGFWIENYISLQKENHLKIYLRLTIECEMFDGFLGERRRTIAYFCTINCQFQVAHVQCSIHCTLKSEIPPKIVLHNLQIFSETWNLLFFSSKSKSRSSPEWTIEIHWKCSASENRKSWKWKSFPHFTQAHILNEALRIFF